MNKPTDTRAAIAAEVRAALARDGRTAAALAQAAGLSRGALSRKMRGEVSFSVEEALRIALALDIDAMALLAPASLAHTA